MARVSWTWAVALLIGLAGCRDEPAPVVVAKRFASAVRSRNPEELLSTVDGQAIAYAQRLASRAGDQIGGRRSVDAGEMLQVVDVDPHFGSGRAELIAQTEDSARVRFVGVDGTEHELELVREGGAWKVVLPTP